MTQRFEGTDLRGARFVESDLSGAVMRGVEVSGLDIDAPWLEHGDGFVVNGVDVTAFVVAELDRRFPGRALRRAASPEELREAWAAAEQAWADAVDRAGALPDGAVDTSVDGEWSFAQTLRHLVLATDLWFRHAVLRDHQPFHPLGLAGPGAAEEGLDMSVFTTEVPTWEDVLAARADRVAQVRDFLAAVTPEQLDEPRVNPWSGTPETTRSCVHVILEEEWEHLRYALRDLDTLEAPPSSTSATPAPTAQ